MKTDSSCPARLSVGLAIAVVSSSCPDTCVFDGKDIKLWTGDGAQKDLRLSTQVIGPTSVCNVRVVKGKIQCNDLLVE